MTKSDRNVNNKFLPPVGWSETARASGELYAASVLSGMSQQLWQDMNYAAVYSSYLSGCFFFLVTTAVLAGNKSTWFFCGLQLGL